MQFSEEWLKARNYGTLRPVSSLKKGDKFTCIQGAHWTYDHDHRGCVYVRDADGNEDCFAACASVLKGWV